MPSEATIERYLVQEVGKAGGIPYKFTSPNRRFVPDRLCILPGGLICFVECKSPTGRLSSGQDREITRLKHLGQDVRVIDSKEGVDQLIQEIYDAL